MCFFSFFFYYYCYYYYYLLLHCPLTHDISTHVGEMECFHRLPHHSYEIDGHLVGHNEAAIVYKAHLVQAEDAEVRSDEERVVISGVGERTERKECTAGSGRRWEVER